MFKSKNEDGSLNLSPKASLFRKGKTLSQQDLAEQLQLQEIHLKELREQYNYTKTQIANYIGVTKRTYSNYENGKTKIPVKVLIKLSYYYNTSVDYLIGFTDDPVPHERRPLE
ncbi:helix-turn-helix domain-containing protein [Anaeropeptidivorans aminofermentans]|uniref:helix-turn-helix domain-containing protein n=1 Tax=Anaeropeptidivorans aminofermentans TaxID=2934315 RepID=UPI002023D79A|nr:helix-turn-helix transcriptional regulator [Anaeropeptidivorans aminofermentans]MBE6013158.1 helix-turn-helix transcriptional regulator [Lachnospiraceae bacterium]